MWNAPNTAEEGADGHTQFSFALLEPPAKHDMVGPELLRNASMDGLSLFDSNLMTNQSFALYSMIINRQGLKSAISEIWKPETTLKM